MAPAERPASPSRLPLLIVLGVLVAAGLWQWRHTASSADVSAPREASGATAAPAAARAERGSMAPHDLSRDESHGGHTLTRHVGRSDADLRDRLRRERISAASTYTDRAAAEMTVARALVQQAERVARWEARSGARPNLALDYHGDPSEPIGRSLERNSATTVPCYDAVVVLRWDGDNYFVLTSYPEARR
jgi:hypothetical protein